MFARYLPTVLFCVAFASISIVHAADHVIYVRDGAAKDANASCS